MPSWKLRVWAPATTAANQTDANATIYTPASPGGLLDGFTWSRTPAGGCKEMRFMGSPSDRDGTQRLDIGPRDIVQLQLDDDDTGIFHNQFKGLIIECPNPNDPRKGEYVAVGLRKLIEGALVDDRNIDTEQDVAQFVADLGDLVPAQIDMPVSFVATGFNLSKFYAPYIKLSQAFDLFKQSVATYEWDVDAAGTFFFAEPSGNLSLDADEADIRYLPVAAEGIITKPTLIVLSGPVPREAVVGVDHSESAGDIASYTAQPVIYDGYEDPEHVTYNAEAAFVLPYSESNFMVGTEGPALTTSNITNASNATDGDPSTAATNTAAGDYQLSCGLTDVSNYDLLGVRLRYHLAGGTATLSLRRRVASSLALSYKYDHLELALPQATGTSTIVVLYPFDVGVGGFRNGFYQVSGTADNAGDVSVYEIEPLILNTSELDRIAQALVRLPASEPTQLTLYRYEAPVATVTITGAHGNPDGDAKEWRYEVSTKGLTTTIDLGVREESEDARVIRLKAQSISDAAQGALRLHRPPK